MTPEVLAAVEDVLARFVDALDAAEAREAGQLDADFHLTIYEASGSELMSVLRGYWTRLQLELSERVYNTELPRRFLDEHVAILDALGKATPARAGADAQAHRAQPHDAEGVPRSRRIRG